MERQETPGSGAARRAACAECDWYHVHINRATADPRPRADLEALYGAHLHRTHAPRGAHGG